uniref:Mesoderm development candidate 2 n=1 Tax=Panagrolaimus sp. PS1159 TaxID=55785 RepID=A0AC35GBV7_9BILA
MKYLLPFTIIYIIFAFSILVAAEKEKEKKDIRDFTDADIDRLYDEWEENDEDELEEDEKPGYMPKKSQIDFDSMLKNAKSPEDVLAASKRGMPVMMFVSITNPTGEAVTKQFSDKLSQFWQTSLFNNHIDVQVYPVEETRMLLMFKEGSQAFEARDFIIKQKECIEITLEGKSMIGAGGRKNEL